MELCYYKSEGVAGSWLRLSSHLGVQTTWRHPAGFQGRSAGSIQHWSARPEAAHTDVAAHWSQRFYIVWAFSKTNSYWKEPVRTAAFYGSVWKETNHLVFLFMTVMMGIFFFSHFWICGPWGEREGKHKRETALKTGLFEKALTMQALCCDLVCPHWAEQRNGKDYPQECLGCPQTEQAAWLANGREACRAAG